MMRLHFTVEQKWHMCLSTCVDASGRGGSTCVLPRSMCLLCIKYTYGVLELIIRAISFVAIRFGPFFENPPIFDRWEVGSEVRTQVWRACCEIREPRF